MLKNWRAFLLRHELLIIILCLTALLRLPSLMEPYWYGDEGIYLTLGNGIRAGRTLYQQIHDNKPPGIYYLAAIAGSLFWFRFILLFWNLANVAVFHWLADKVLKSKTGPPIMLGGIAFPRPTLTTLATLVFAWLPFLVEGNIANGEIFMIFPVVVGFALLYAMREAPSKRRKLMLCALSGISFSLAFLIKVPSMFDFLAAGVIFFLMTPKDTLNFRGRVAHFLRGLISPLPWIFGAAFLLPILLSIGYYYAMGAGEPYLRAALLQNVGYLSSWSTGSQQANLAETGLAGRALGLGVFTLILIFVPLNLGSGSAAVLLWLAFALFGALLSERPYPHYLIQIIPPISLLTGLLLQKLKKLISRSEVKKEGLGLAALLISLMVIAYALIALKFWRYPVSPYYQNYFNFMTGRIPRDQYLSYFDRSLPEQYMLATYIKTRTTKDDPIFVWGELPSLYALTRRLPPGRYTAAYHVKDFNAYEETFAAILKNPPKFILIDRITETYKQLSGVLAEEYVIVSQSERFTLYRRADL